MGLKELTLESHRAAENTLFMQAIFKQNLPQDVWVDFTYQKWIFYGALEGCASAVGLFGDLPDIRRYFYLYCDWVEGAKGIHSTSNKTTLDYYNYIHSLYPDSKRLMAHVYVWHMGDLYGGQSIRKLVPGNHRALEFKDPQGLILKIREKIDDSMSDEANVAFSWAIKLLKEYDTRLEQN